MKSQPGTVPGTGCDGTAMQVIKEERDQHRPMI